MRKAVIYGRVSTGLQEKEQTIESQVNELKRQIATSGDLLVKEYLDEGYSGAFLDRPALNQLRKDLKTDTYDIIYVLCIDRLARDAIHINILISEVLVNKKQIIINGEDYINNPENKFKITVLGAVAELEKAKILERTTRGRLHRLKQGHLVSQGHNIFGYNYFRRTQTSYPYYEINNPKAKIVKYLYECYAKGNVSIKTIFKKLQKTELVSPSIKVAYSKVKCILNNESYTGIKYFNTMRYQHVMDGLGQKTKTKKLIYTDRSEWIGIKIPAIITKGLFTKVQKQLEYNKTCYRNARGTQLLSNLVFCGKCKHRCIAYRKFYSVRRASGVKFYKKAYYKCHAKGSVHNPQIDTRILESHVFEMIKEIMFNPQLLRGYISLFKSPDKNNKSLIMRQLDSVEKELANFKKQKQRILELYAKGGIGQGDYFKQMINFEDQLQKLEESRKTILARMPLYQKPELVEKSLEEYSKKIKSQIQRNNEFNTLRQFFLDHIQKVEYNKSQFSNRTVYLYGSVPIKVKEQETVPVEFKIRKILSKQDELLKQKEIDANDCTISGKELLKTQFRKLTQEAI